MIRAYSLFEIKAVNDEEGVIEGIASTPTTDRMGDIVEPKGAEFKLPLPLLWQHSARDPLGHVISAKVTDAGIAIKAKILRGVLPEIDRAWALIKAGLVRGLSIGFRSIEDSDIKGTWGRRFTKWEWLELSAVTIPANSEATIQTIKSIDEELLRSTAPGQPAQRNVVVRIKSSGASDIPQPKQGATNMNLKEQIAGFEAKRAANVAAMTQLMKDAEGATLDAGKQEEYDTLEAEVSQIDGHLKRLKTLEKMNADTATPVPTSAGTTEDTSRRVRAGEGVLRPNANLPKGMGLARYAKALAFSKGNYESAIKYAEQWNTSTPEVVEALKAAVAAGTTSDAAWAGPLVYSENLTSEFVEYLRPQTIIGKMPGLRRVPFNVRYPTQSAGASVGWVGQGAAKKVGKLQLSYGTLGFAKAAGIVVITQELARFSSPSAELMVRDDLASEMRYFLDAQFIDPGVAAVANVNPASVLNGASNVRQAAAAWTTAANVETDVKAFLATFATQEISLDGAVWVMTPDAALALSMIRTTGGENFAYPGINMMGGTWFGMPVITSNAVPHSTSAGSIVALVKQSEVFLADDGAIAIDVSTEASLEMDSAPSGSSATPTAAQLVSMFQTNSMAIRCERVINWSRRRSYGVGYIDNMHTS
ncbi:MAG: phage major capsid protein [Candidatus Hydrogenedentes bacterium]|nr:phage major capsid protein [Candidatus Hydrogenedentota bacterium]